jgi:UDP-glucose 4-epimerase
MAGRRYLVTGGSGFIGSHLVDALLAAGNAVRVLDDFSSGKAAHLAQAERSGRLEVVRADVRDFAAVETAVAGAEGVFHLAALVSVPQSLADPRRSFEINLGGTVNVLEAARARGARRVVFASSAAVYGDAPGAAREDETPLRPLSPYAVDKLAAEQYCALYSDRYGLETAALRFFNVYGQRQDPASPYSGVISVFADRLRRRDGVTIYGDGKQTRDFVHVSDVVQAMTAAMAADRAGFTVCNIGTGNAVGIGRLLETLAGLAGWQPSIDRQPARQGDIRHSCADIHRARELLGYVPRRDLAAGLRELLAT